MALIAAVSSSLLIFSFKKEAERWRRARLTALLSTWPGQNKNLAGPESCGSCSSSVWMLGCLVPWGGFGGWYGWGTAPAHYWTLMAVSPAALWSCSEVQRGTTHTHGAILTVEIMWTCTHKHACAQTCQGHCASHTLFVYAWVCSCARGLLRASFFFFFVGLIKADTVQSRGLRGEIKVLLLPLEGGRGWLPVN